MNIDTIIQKYGVPPEIVERNVDGYKYTPFYNDDGEFVENYSGVTGGHSVQVVIYDHNEKAVMVFVDNSAKIMPKKEVMDYIKGCLLD